MASTSEKARVDQIVGEFFAKTLHIILDSRIPLPSLQDRSESSTSSAVLRGSDRWFNLELDRPDLISEHVEPWKRSYLEPMVVDIFLRQPGGTDSTLHSSSQVSVPSGTGSLGSDISNEGSDRVRGGDVSMTLLERWVVRYERRGKLSRSGSAGSSRGPGSGGAHIVAEGRGGGGDGILIEVPVVYKHTVIMLRSLYCLARALPAHRLAKLAKAASNKTFFLTYRVSPSPPSLTDADAAAMSTSRLTPVDTPTARMCLSVAYRHTTAVTALEVSPSILPHIITDYMGSLGTDALRRYSSDADIPVVGCASAARGVHVVPLVAMGPSSEPLSRRQSWGLPQTLTRAQTQTQTQTPNLGNPSHPMAVRHAANEYLYSTATSSSPPYSPSSSPSPPANRRGISTLSTAPLSIPGTGGNAPQLPILYPTTSLAPRGASISARDPLQHSPSNLPPLTRSPRYHHRSSPPQWQPSSAPAANQRNAMHQATGGRTLAQYYGGGARAQLAEGSSPPLPFASTPIASASLLTMAPIEGQLAALQRATPPFSGRDASALALARLPSFDLKSSPRLNISALADSTLVVSPPHPYHIFPQVLGSGRGSSGPPSSGGLSVFRVPRLAYLEGGHREGQGGGAEEEEEFLLPFAVDDEDLMRRSRVGGVSSPEGVSEGMEGGHSGGPMSSRHAQDAAVGALVRTLRAAPPLRHMSGGWGGGAGGRGGSPATSSRLPSLKNSPGEGGGKWRGLLREGSGKVYGMGGGGKIGGEYKGLGGGAGYGGEMLEGLGQGGGRKEICDQARAGRSSADALRELAEYTEMREGLLRRRGEGGYEKHFTGDVSVDE